MDEENLFHVNHIFHTLMINCNIDVLGILHEIAGILTSNAMNIHKHYTAPAKRTHAKAYNI